MARILLLVGQGDVGKLARYFQQTQTVVVEGGIFECDVEVTVGPGRLVVVAMIDEEGELLQGEVLLERTRLVGDGGQHEVAFILFPPLEAFAHHGYAVGTHGIKPYVDGQSFQCLVVKSFSLGIPSLPVAALGLPVGVVGRSGRKCLDEGILIGHLLLIIYGGVDIVVGIFSPHAVHPFEGRIIPHEQFG